jgi:threonyl-tRNA synthetase
MKILALHSDFVEFEPKKEAIKNAEKVEKKRQRYEECLVVFSAVEKPDEENPDSVVKGAAENVRDIAQQVNAKRIVLYPWVHLTNTPSSPSTAVRVFKELEKALKKEFEVHRAPFGWYKEFQIKCKGHPLAELSREIKAEEGEDEVSKALKAEEKLLKSRWYILDLDGKLHEIRVEKGDVKGFDFSKYPNLEKFALYEMAKSREIKQEPPHVKLMRKLELADYEAGSDPGNLRYPPKGRMMKALLEHYVTDEVLDYGAMEIEAPIMYDFEHPALKSYLNRFPARQYAIQTPNKRVFLRFAACFGQFLMAHDATISYKDLPMRMYELTKYSFRVEKRGELTGLRRLRAFTMPDCHAFCTDVEQAKQELLRRFELAWKIQTGIGLKMPDDLEFAIRTVEPFYKENKKYIVGMVKKWGKPALVEIWNKQFFYFILKYEWNFVDALDKASALTTDQIDVENGKRYGIKFVDKDGKEKDVIILHLSPSGAIERAMYALLEREHMKQQKGEVPQLPLWLAPTQVRIAPVSGDFLAFARELAEELKHSRIRADIDDRELTVGKKIRDAEEEWVPYVLVVGEKEKRSGKLAVRMRGRKGQREMSAKNLVADIHKQTKGMPFRRLPLPELLSRRPTFIG